MFLPMEAWAVKSKSAETAKAGFTSKHMLSLTAEFGMPSKYILFSLECWYISPLWDAKFALPSGGTNYPWCYLTDKGLFCAVSFYVIQPTALI